MLDFWYDGFDDSLLCDEMFRREDYDLIHIFDETMCEMLDPRYTFESISEKLESDNRFTRARPDLEYISFYKKHSSLPIGC